MNERIRELEAECWDYARGIVNTQKFAKLIVEECIRELEISRKCDRYTGDLFNCEYDTCINEQIIVLKEHFGVEE